MPSLGCISMSVDSSAGSNGMAASSTNWKQQSLPIVPVAAYTVSEETNSTAIKETRQHHLA